MWNDNTPPLSCDEQITIKMYFAHLQSQTRSPQYQCTYQVWLNPLIFTRYCPEMKIPTCGGQITLSKIDKICPLAIPNQITTISIQKPSLVKIHWHSLKLSSGNENMNKWQADNSVKTWWNLPIRDPKPDLHNINAHTKFDENPFMFTQVTIRKGNTDGWTYNRCTDWRTDTQTSNVKP